MSTAEEAIARSDERAPLSAWAMVALLSLLYILSFLDRTVIALMVTPIRQDLGISDVGIGMIVGVAFAIFYSIMGLPMGWLVDKVPRRLIVFIGVTLWSIAQTAGGFAGTFLHLFIARLMLGVGEATLTPASHSMISDLFPRRQLAAAMSLYSVGSSTGIGLSLLIGGVLVGYASRYDNIVVPMLGTFHSWQLVFIATGLPGFFLAALIFLFREPRRRVRSAREGGEAGSQIGFFGFLRRNWGLWICLTLSFGIMNIANGALVFWQPAYLTRHFQWSPLQAGMTLGLMQLVVGISGMLFSGRIVDRMFARGVRDAHLRFYLYVLLATTPIVVIALISSSIWLYLGLIWIAIFVTVNSLGYSTAGVMLITPGGLRGRASALFTSLILAMLGQGLGPLIPAIIAEHVLHDTVRIGYSIAITVAACAAIAIPALIYGMPLFRKALDENSA